MNSDIESADDFANAVCAELFARGECCAVKVLPSTDSTNSDCLRLLRAGQISAPFALFAKRQNCGRGRLGRKWFSDPRASLAVSICVALEKKAEVMESFTVRAGLGVCAALEKLCGAELYLKWPNDIYTRDGRKVAGMLAELELAQNAATAVFGIGLNVDFSKLPTSEIPEEIRGICADLFGVSKNRPTFASVASAIVAGVLNADSYTEKITDSFSVRDWLKNKKINLTVGAEKFTAIADGVDVRGRLKARLADGSERLVCSGEATIGRF